MGGVLPPPCVLVGANRCTEERAEAMKASNAAWKDRSSFRESKYEIKDRIRQENFINRFRFLVL